MANISFTAVVLAVAALCFSSLAGLVYAEYLFVEGKVYCDTCRVEFQTQLSENLPGATVRLECRSPANGTMVYSTEGVTDNNGAYKLTVDDDFEDDICEVSLVKSPREDCNEKFGSFERARVLLTKQVAIVGSSRYANPLGFKVKTASPECGKVLKGMGFLPIEPQQVS